MEPTSGIEPLTCRLRMPKADTTTNSINDLRLGSIVLNMLNHGNWQLTGTAIGNAVRSSGKCKASVITLNAVPVEFVFVLAKCRN